MASEEQKTELQKICADLEAKITAKNQELADLNKSIHARIDAAEGDLRMAKLVLEKDIRDLEAKKADLSGTVTAALAEATAEKIRLAHESELLKTAQANLDGDRAQIVNQIHDVAAREKTLKDAQEKLSKDLKDAEATINEANSLIGKARIEKADAASLKATAEQMYEDADAKRMKADYAVADLTAQANKKLKEAQDTLAAADEKEKAVTAQISDVQRMKEEYTKKLEESMAFSKTNSEVADKLSSWEAALQSEYWKMQEDKAKLATAEREFAAKLKGEK